MAAVRKFGKVEKYLPDFAVILKRTPRLPPTHASFIVPLWFSKLDIRDYLWNAYGVQIQKQKTTVYVRQGEVYEGDPRLNMPMRNRKNRAKATKHMTVELVDPFVWPEKGKEVSEDLEVQKANDREDPWRESERKKSNDAGLVQQKQILPRRRRNMEPNDDRRDALRQQAKALLEGKEKWRPGLGKGY